MVESLLALALVFLVALFLFIAYKNRTPSFDAKLKVLDARLAANPDNATLYLQSAEVAARAGASWSALDYLEKASLLGADKQQLEPTFYECYRGITQARYSTQDGTGSDYHPTQKLWRKLNDAAPTLMKSIACALWDCESNFKLREVNPLLDADTASRLELLNSTDAINVPE